MEPTEPRLFKFNDDLKQSIKYFDAALIENDEDYTSVSHLMSIYGASDIPLTSSALVAAEVYESVYWDANDVNGTLNLSNILLKSGNTTRSCEYFQTVKKQAENVPNRKKSRLFNRVKLMEPRFSDKCDLT